jgi:hypothetical protein
MTQRERDEFFVQLAQAMPGENYPAIMETGQRLMRAASAHLRACEGDCSIEPPNHDYDDDEAGKLGYWSRRQAAALKAAERVCPDGWTVEYQGDPRGGTLWIEKAGCKLYPPANGFPASVYR